MPPLPTADQVVMGEGDAARALIDQETIACASTLPAGPPRQSIPLPELSGYKMLSVLGRGGMGMVYLADQISLERKVAIKVLQDKESVDQPFVERFKREARALAKLQHPNIVAVYESGLTAQGAVYFAMEYVEGADLSRLMSLGGLSVPQALEITEQVCDALAYAHQRGIVHRDIKPSNVLVDRFGQAKVADFGLAHVSTHLDTLTLPGVVMGTPAYMAPEQVCNTSAVDHRADVFSIGVMLYQMLTGELPRGNFKPPSVKVAGLDQQLDVITARALEPDRNDRYQSVSDIKTSLNEVLDRMSWRTASRQKRGTGVLSPPRRHTLLWTTLGVSALAVLAGGAWMAAQPSFWKEMRSTKSSVTREGKSRSSRVIPSSGEPMGAADVPVQSESQQSVKAPVREAVLEDRIPPASSEPVEAKLVTASTPDAPQQGEQAEVSVPSEEPASTKEKEFSGKVVLKESVKSSKDDAGLISLFPSGTPERPGPAHKEARAVKADAPGKPTESPGMPGPVKDKSQLIPLFGAKPPSSPDPNDPNCPRPAAPIKIGP